jgi:hypothetical protein
MGHRLNLEGKIGRLIDKVCADDRRWFDEHPDATTRLRDMVEGEFAPLTLVPPAGFFYAVRVEILCREEYGTKVRRRLPVLIANYD